MRHVRGTLVPSCLALVALLFAGAPASAQLDDKAAEAAIKAALKPVAKDQKAQLSDAVGEVTSQVKEKGKAVSSGASAPGEGASTLSETAAELHGTLAGLTNTALQTGVQLGLADVLSQVTTVPAGALVGTGGTLDKTLARLGKQHRISLAKGRKALVALVKTLAKAGLPAAVRGTEPALSAVAPVIPSDPGGGDPEGTATPGLAPPALLGALVGSSDADVPGDGALRIRGALLRAGHPVTVWGQGPEGETFGPLMAEPDPGNPSLDTYTTEVTGLAEGNWRVEVRQLGVVAADYVGVPGAPDPGTDANDEKTVAKSAKTGWKSFVKQHAADAKQAGKQFAERLKSVQGDVAAGGDIFTAMEDTITAVDTFQESMDAVTNDDLGAAANVVFSLALDSIDQVVPDQLVGNGSVNDTSAGKVVKRCTTTTDKARKAALALARSLAKSSDLRLAVKLEPAQFQRVAPVKGTKLPALPVPLRVEALVGFSMQTAANDGVLWLRLTGDEAQGAQIVVTLLGPDGSTTHVSVSAADAEDGNTLRFPETGPGTLAEGNYLVLLTQRDTQVTASIAVPGAP